MHVRGKDIHAEAVDADMYAAIDALVDKLDRQVLKHKEKLSAHRTDRETIERSLAAAGDPTLPLQNDRRIIRRFSRRAGARAFGRPAVSLPGTSRTPPLADEPDRPTAARSTTSRSTSTSPARSGCSSRSARCSRTPTPDRRATVFDSLSAREKLGSTGLGQGIAIPHGRIKGLTRSARRLRAPARARSPFDAPDGKPVSQVFVLLVPEHATDLHLQLLSELAQMFCERAFREQLATAQRAMTSTCCSRCAATWAFRRQARRQLGAAQAP